ncbi:MAG TPA: glycosyltransferase family 9 protein [Bryobacteraceae bacterium]|jgi:ADP-heptose:LPS heptosyltransferase|nr:glycosyltransferase family 9 protein [Bryobacteraceae bacterium]
MTPCNERATVLLDYSLRGEAWPPEMLRELADGGCSDALFRIVAEGLADRFEPALCDTYARLFAEAIAPGESTALVERYRRVRIPRLVTGEPRTVFVLSRVTLGADVAVTSVILDAAKRRFPEAAIYLVGPRKNWELFAADPRILHLPVTYRRGTLRERLAAGPELRAALDRPDSIVIDPDSRLTQLGLLPVCPEERYYFFESRAYGGDGDDSLPALTRRWVSQTSGVCDAAPFVALAPSAIPTPPCIAISLGVGENPAKRIADPFEADLLALLSQTGLPLIIDEGAGGEEAARVDRAIAHSGATVERWNGSFAGFASIIARSRLYVGYDSAGQHVAAACGIPLVSIFAGFACPRMFARWRPAGDVIRVDDPRPAWVLAEVRRLLPALRK